MLGQDCENDDQHNNCLKPCHFKGTLLLYRTVCALCQVLMSFWFRFIHFLWISFCFRFFFILGDGRTNFGFVFFTLFHWYIFRFDLLLWLCNRRSLGHRLLLDRWSDLFRSGIGNEIVIFPRLTRNWFENNVIGRFSWA